MRILLILFFISIGNILQAQSIEGKWVTYDDKTNEKKAIVEMYSSNDAYFAKIIHTFSGELDDTCEKCKGEKHKQPIIDLVIIEGLIKNGTQYEDGTILDPENGETYSCFVELESKNKLKVRGFIGFSLFGRTQYWLRQ